MTVKNVCLLAAVFAVAGCAGMETASRPAPAVGAAPVVACAALMERFVHPGVRLVSAEQVPAGKLTLAGIAQPMPEHCVVQGRMNERTSDVDGKRYAIGFEMRLPTAWNGRFFYQANGGLDGMLPPAYGDILGGGPASNGLLKGFAVISSDAGHAMERVPGIGGALFGLDPQARLDYGYQALGRLTPMAKELIRAYYGKRPERAYIVGTSNGGRHAMVAAARYPDEYDGALAGAPGYNLPRAAVAQVWGAQQFAAIARKNPDNGRPDLATSFTPADLALVSAKILERCDALDGLADGIVADLPGCQRRFRPESDLPVCAGAADGGCLTAAQKSVLQTVFAGPKNRDGTPFYAGLPWDAGIRGSDWRAWKFSHSVGPRDAVALAFVFTTPPASPEVVNGKGTSLIDHALNFSLERDAPKIFATEGRYAESAMSFMTPPEATRLDRFVARGGKLMVFHGASDPVFSAQDTIAWYESFRARHGRRADEAARLFVVPGMNHGRGGLATDQFDMVDALVAWVEQGVAPEAIVARARGAGAAVANPELPPAWAPGRTRLLCPYPAVPRHVGGNSEEAAGFTCLVPF